MLGWLLQKALELLIGVAIGVVIGLITYKVCEIVSQSNIGQVIRNALRSSKEETAKKMLGHQLKGIIKSKGVNTIKLQILAEGMPDKLDLEIQCEGVSSDLREGMEIAA